MIQLWGREISKGINMRPYIQNLTDYLIGKNKFDELVKQVTATDLFVSQVKSSLWNDEISIMRPDTLGRIMCSFELGDVQCRNPGHEIGFSGDCEMMLRELVAVCLAWTIWARLRDDQERESTVPRYQRT